MRIHPALRLLVLGIMFGLLTTMPASADEVYGRIRGIITDPSGAVIPNVKVTETNAGTGISKQTSSASDGTYEFLQLTAPGDYKVSAQASGFKVYEATGIHLNLGQIYVLNIEMEVGTVTQQVVVEATATQVEKTSMELGANLSSRDLTELPLIGRNWINLQQTLPGTVATGDRFGTTYGTNGTRAQFNSYMVNGTDANDLPLNTPLFVPSPDAIGEVHIITNTINPEYGRNSGAIMNAVTKSGTNQFHGSGFDFYRDTSLNTRNFFSFSAAVFHQNLFGGTIGGPIWKNHTFFFFSYQGNRRVTPEAGGAVTVFTADQRNGVFSTIAGQAGADLCSSGELACLSPHPMVGEDGNTYPAGTPYSTLFPTGSIPAADIDPVAEDLMTTYVPDMNKSCGTGCGEYDFNPTITGKQDQEIVRIDHTFSSKDALWGYTFIQRNPSANELPFSGATLPGFSSVSKSNSFSGTLSWNHTFSGSALNEARFGYSRLNFAANFPEKPTLPSSAGFNITPQYPDLGGLPIVNLTGYFELGFTNNGPQPRIDQTYQVNDNFSKIIGRHMIKMGFETRRMQVYNPFASTNSGSFAFGGGGPYSTGDPGADFLLGFPDTYSQGTGDVINARAQEYYAYFQDQFKLKPNFTATFGLAWQMDTPIVDNYHGGKAINCWISGQQSKVFPTAPEGSNYPGDPGCTESGYTNHPAHFGPRLGFAWSPGKGGKTSVRGGFGIYFNRTEEELTLQNLGAPPWGLTSAGVSDASATLIPSFANPWKDVASGTSIANKFPYNPDPSNVDFSQLGYMYITTTDPNFTVPYAYNYNLTVERELPGNTLASVAYVGSQGRKLHGIYNLNYDVNPTGCAADPVCVAYRPYQKILFPENERYTGVTNTGVIGIGSESTFLSSNYNSLQVTVNKRTSRGLSFLASYTWAHSLDYSSSLEDDSFGGLAFDPTDFHSNYGNSSLDARHRFTLSYVYEVPKIRRAESNWVARRAVNGWEISGVTTFQTGFPVQIYESTWRELRCDAFDWTVCPDRPNQVGALKLVNPRTSQFENTVGGRAPLPRDHYWFDPNAFALEDIGTVGNVGRNPFHGPGINNFDFAVYKNIPIIGESKYIQLRFEFYNVFNHTQFNAIAIQSLASNVVSGNAASSNFGRITSAFDPRLIQLAAKIYF
jgi:hypothetical protein